MKKEKGITLIALVITIIVLIILAMVTINYVFDKNLIQRAASSNETSTIESIREKLELVKGNMYIDNKGKSSIEAYMTSLGEKDLEPHIPTSKSILSDTLGIVVVDNKYSYLIKFDNNISVEYEGKIGEIKREEQVVEIILTAEETQSELPISLSAQVTVDEENAKSGTWRFAKVSEEVEENVATGTIEETGSIALEVSEIGTYNLHVITTDDYNRTTETIKGPITIEADYHIHTGSSTSGGGCYTKVNSSHSHSIACVPWMIVNIGEEIYCTKCRLHVGTGWGENNKSYYCGHCYSAGRWICGKSTEVTYSIDCNKTEGVTVEIYKISY